MNAPSASRAAFDRDLVAAMPNLRRRCMSLAKTAWGADDLMQETCAKALAYRDSFTMGTNMGAWLGFIAKNLFLSEKRRSWRMCEMADGQAERVPAPASAHQFVELRDLMTAMTHLPAEQRDALLAVGLQGEDYETAASDLGVGVGTIKSRVSRGRSALELWFGATG